MIQNMIINRSRFCSVSLRLYALFLRVELLGDAPSCPACIALFHVKVFILNSKCSSFYTYSAKGFQHQRMTNGAMNVEIGNPAYKIYEGEQDDDVGELLDSDFTLDPDKVRKLERRFVRFDAE